LIKNNNFPIDNKQIEKIFKESKGNFRNGFFKLYDLFEESLPVTCNQGEICNLTNAY
jgi:hypothetical protein